MNSPTIDALYAHIETAWAGVVVPGSTERPWSTLEAHLEALSPFEAELIGNSTIWKKFLTEHLVDDELERFHEQLATRRCVQ